MAEHLCLLGDANSVHLRRWALDVATGALIAAPAYWLFTLVLDINLPGLTGTGWL